MSSNQNRPRAKTTAEPINPPNQRLRSLTRSVSKGDTFTLLNDALRLQNSIKATINAFTFKRKLCKELQAQLEQCDKFLESLITKYDNLKYQLEGKEYFVAFMEYVEILNRTSEFVVLLKEKGLFTRLKNQERYREATRVYAVEMGKAISYLIGLQNIDTSNQLKENKYSQGHSTMKTINGTLKILNDHFLEDKDQDISEEFNKKLDISSKTQLFDIFDHKELRQHIISRRSLKRQNDSLISYPLYQLYKSTYNSITVSEKVYNNLDPEISKGIQQETLKWLQLRTNNYVAFIYGLWNDGENLGIITDYFEAGNLFELIQKHVDKGDQIDLLTRLRFTYNLIEAVSNLHSQNIVHGGITPYNLMVTPNLTLQFSGFETLPLRLLSDQKDLFIPYTPPEILKSEDIAKSSFSMKGDIYCLGMVLGCIWTSSFPYEVGSNLKDAILNGEKPQWIDKLCTSTLDFIEKCINIDPNVRPTAAEMESEMRTIFNNGTMLSNSPNVLKPHITGLDMSYNDPQYNFSLEISQNMSLSPNSYAFRNDMRSASCTSLIDGFKNLAISTPKGNTLSPAASPILADVSEFSNTLSGYDSQSTPFQSPHQTRDLVYDTSTSSQLSLTENNTSSSSITLAEAIHLHSIQQYEKAYAYFLYLSEVELRPEALYYIGLYHYSGKPGFLAPNPSLALNYLQRSAQLGYGDAYDYLGLHHLDVSLDFEKAIGYFKLAAKYLSGAGCYHLSMCYRNGHGTSINEELAFYHLQLAASLGYKPAINMLEQELHLKGLENKVDEYKIKDKNDNEVVMKHPANPVPGINVEGVFE